MTLGVIVPLPVGASEAPVPTSIAAVVFVPEVRAEKALPLPDPQAAPVSTTVHTPPELVGCPQ